MKKIFYSTKCSLGTVFFKVSHFILAIFWGLAFIFSFGFLLVFSSTPIYADDLEEVETAGATLGATSEEEVTETATKQSSSDIKFSGGYTKVNMQEDNRTVSLSGGANVSANDISINAQTIELYGKNFRYVNCSGKVNVVDNSRDITLQCPSLFYDRETGEIISDGWIEIQDEQNDATLSGARFEYDTQSTLIRIQMMARVVKNTDNGPMICRADTIEFDNSKQLVTLKGSARINWNGSVYNASVITVDLTSYEITMEGSISGEVNG